MPHALVVLVFAALVAPAVVLADFTISDGSPTVVTPDGPLKGFILKSRNSRDYYAFRGIKYAVAPQRFQLAQPLKAWSELKDATNFGPICPQSLLVGRNSSEDCLYLNVYVPKTGSQDNLPVMFWVHGGGFYLGAGSEFGGDFFMDEDVILVTINYRLGVLGFLDLEDGTVPANNGLKDIVLALKWVQRNIEAFGGDPKRVTIFGESAGGCLVHSLRISPAAKGLFSGVIAQSGSALVPWSVIADPKAQALKLARKVECPADGTTAQILQCLRGKDVDALIAAQDEMTNVVALHLPFAPSIEEITCKSGDGSGEDYAFFPAAPYELITRAESDDVALMVGHTEDEGVTVSAGYFIANETLMSDLSQNWPTLFPQYFDYESYVPAGKLTEFGQKLKQIYYGDSPVSMETSRSLINLHTELYFARGGRLAAELEAHSGRSNRVYQYVFAYRGHYSYAQALGLEPQGSAHGDDLLYLFDTPENPWEAPDLIPGSRDEDFSKQFVKLWASFAIDGAPTKSWGDTWKPLEFSQLEDRNYPVMWLESKAVFASETKERFDRMKRVDTLFSKFEKPQRSWRVGKELKDEL